MPLKLMYITNNSDIAAIAQKHGVDRVFIDLETKGKAERQANRDTVQSKHSIEDITRIKSVLTTSKLLVRVNPIDRHSKSEIEAVIKAGADIVMLPMWKSAVEVRQFIDFISGRAKVCLLLETREAVECLDDVILLQDIDEIHIGLNDLHISYGLSFMFELLSNGMIERICRRIQHYGIPYGFGGIARIGEGQLPAEKIIMEHYRLGSTMTILSRSFCSTDKTRSLQEIEKAFHDGTIAVREFEEKLSKYSEMQFYKNKIEVGDIVQRIVQPIKPERGNELKYG